MIQTCGKIVLVGLFFVIVSVSSIVLNKSVKAFSLGIDYGTSGVRSCLIDYDNRIVNQNSINWDSCSNSNSYGDSNTGGLTAVSPKSWLDALLLIIDKIPANDRASIARICVSGTSASALMYNKMDNKVSRDVRMYNYNILAENAELGKKVMGIIKDYAPVGSPTVSSTSTLAKLLLWQLQNPISKDEVLLHQADYLANYLVKELALNEAKSPHNFFASDWHNALKLGFDVKNLCYPKWLVNCLIDSGVSSNVDSCTSLLPRVVEPGKSIGYISSGLSVKLNIPHDCEIIAGTTDSIAAFIASAADEPGEAVSSLGSTLAVKALSKVPVEDSSMGIYSHRLGDTWLVGGASNVGCAILRKEEFSDSELMQLSEMIDPYEDIPEFSAVYYPLMKPGERFPFNDPEKQPVLDPKPLATDGKVDRRKYLQSILQSIALIEKAGYDALEELGATPITKVYTAGGGSKNEMWTSMRQRILQRTTTKAANVDAAFGCARLGFKYFNK